MKLNVHVIIDRSPELPYFILALAYLFTTATESAHIFAMAFLYIITSIAIGMALKSFFKTKRPIKHYNLPCLRYDFPSLHSMISIGTIVFVYYVRPLYSLILIPVGLLYLYSRLKTKAHSVAGVLGGALIGTLIGFSFGASLSKVSMPKTLELLLATALFCIPLLTAIFRMKYGRRIDY